MYTRYLQVFNGSKKKGYSHTQSQMRANNAAYRTPSWRAGGVSYKQGYGIKGYRYQEADRRFRNSRAAYSKPIAKAPKTKAATKLIAYLHPGRFYDRYSRNGYGLTPTSWADINKAYGSQTPPMLQPDPCGVGVTSGEES